MAFFQKERFINSRKFRKSIHNPTTKGILRCAFTKDVSKINALAQRQEILVGANKSNNTTDVKYIFDSNKIFCIGLTPLKI